MDHKASGFSGGETVSAYRKSNWLYHELESGPGAAKGSVAASAAADSGGSVTLTGLAENTDYFLYGGTSGRRISIRTRSSAASGVNASDVGYDVILGIGQSNMSGGASDFDATNVDVADSAIFQYATTGPLAGKVARSIEPLGHADFTLAGHTPGMGPLHEFARWYRMTVPANRRVLVVPVGYGGVPFEGADSHAAGKSWKVGGDMPAQAVAQTQAALAAAGANSRLVAMLWMHGEQDTTNGTTGATYRTDLEALIDFLRAQLNASSVPFLIGQQLSNRGNAIDIAQAFTPTRKAYTGYAAGPSPIGSYVDAVNGLPHYNAAGQRLIARALAGRLAAAKDCSAPSASPAQSLLGEAVRRLRASEIAGVAQGGAVAGWNSFTQGTAGSRPTLDLANGEVVFDGVDDCLDDAAFARPTNSTCILVGRLTALPGAANFWMVGNPAGTGLNLGAAASAPKDFLSNAGTTLRQNVPADLAQHVLGGVFGAAGALLVDGTVLSGPTGANTNTGTRIGGSNGLFTPMRVKQILWWDRALTPVELQTVAAYLATNPA